jgi:hypothetical protein
MSAVFDEVETRVSKLIGMTAGGDLAFVDNGRTVSLADAPVKDHLHVYSQV